MVKTISQNQKIAQAENPLNPYLFHGIEFSGRKLTDNLIGNCPFCEKDDHLYISEKTGQFDCKRCGESGNHYTFLQRLYAQCLEQTSEADLQFLTGKKSIPQGILRIHGVAKHCLQDYYVIPGRNEKGNIANLYVWNPETNEIRSTAGCQHQFYLADQLSPPENKSLKPVYILEGFWDGMIWDYVLRRTRERSRFDLLAVPGANVFKRDWVKYLKDRDVYLMFDDDPPDKNQRKAGEAGMKRIINLCGQSISRPRSISTIEWSRIGLLA